MRKLFLLIISVFTVFQSQVFAVGEQKSEEVSVLNGLLSTEKILNFGISMIFAVFIIVVTLIVSRIIRERLIGYLEKSSIGDNGSGREEVIGVISRTINISFLIVGFSAALGVLGVNLGIFMGGIGFGIGFTLKTFLTNFVGGILMVTQGVFHTGDLVEVSGKRGKITKINSLFTSIEQLDGVMFYVPNITFIEEEVLNFHTNDKRRIEVEFAVQYETDITQTKAIVQKIFDNFPNILKAPSSEVVIEKLEGKGILLQGRCWISSRDHYFEVKSNIMETINLAFTEAGIQIAAERVVLIK